MISDAVMVELLKESVLSASSVHQVAARILLDLARRGDLEISPKRIEVVRADAGRDVADAVEALADKLGLMH